LFPKWEHGNLSMMRIIARSTLQRFVQSRSRHRDHTALKSAVDAWFDEVRRAKWTSMATVKELYRSASVVSADRVVFNIKGNDYRLVTAVDFEKHIVWVKWIGTHAEYDRIDVRTVAYERSKADSK
jgi:mRNA interferase HigB